MAALVFAGTALAQAPPSGSSSPEPVSSPTVQPDPSAGKAVRKKPKRHRGCRTYASPTYRKMVHRWQTVPPIPKPKWRDGYRDLTLYSVNLGERIRVFPFRADGTLDPAVVDEIARVMRDKDTDAVHSISARLIKLVYQLAVKLNVRQITIISGYRQPKEEEGGGHHADGTAIDIAFSGVRLPVLAQAARRLGHVGVGFYPTSGFVHLDVREGRSYFWADRSGPGQPGCVRPLDSARAFSYDAKWRVEKDEPIPARNKKGELLGAEPAPPAQTPDGGGAAKPAAAEPIAPNG